MTTIATEFDADTGEWVLMCSHDAMRTPMPAGQRLFRAPPHPDIGFRHAAKANAERDAATLRAYLARVGDRRQTKKEVREVAA